MKKKYFYLLLTAVFYSVFLCGCDRNVKIDEKHFPDDIFREYVETNYDTDSNGVLSAEEIEEIVVLDAGQFEFAEVETTKGIEYFKNLEGVCITGSSATLELSHKKNLERVLYSEGSLDSGEGKVIVKNCPNLQACEVTASEIQFSGCPVVEHLFLRGEKNSNASVKVNKDCFLFQIYGVTINDKQLDFSKCDHLQYLALVDTGLTSVIIDPNTVNRVSCNTDIVLKKKDKLRVCETNVPGDTFSNPDTDRDGFLSTEEMEKVTCLNITTGTYNLIGLDRYPNLEEIRLNVVDNVEMRGSDTPLELTGLSSLETVKISSYRSEICDWEVKITDCENLKWVESEGVEVDLSECPALEYVSIDALDNNVRKSKVDFTGCESLSYVSLYDVDLVETSLKMTEMTEEIDDYVEEDGAYISLYKTNLEKLDLSDCEEIYTIEIVETPLSRLKLPKEYYIDYFCLNNTNLSSVRLFEDSVDEIDSYSWGDVENDVDIEWIY